MVSKGDIVSGPFQVSQCFMYLAPYDNIQVPKVKRNPVTGILEHQNCQWIDIDNLTTEAYDWLGHLFRGHLVLLMLHNPHSSLFYLNWLYIYSRME